MKKIIKKLNNVVNFPKTLNKLERQVEAILFAASEPLDIETGIDENDHFIEKE